MNIFENPHLQKFMHRKKNLIETPKIRSKKKLAKIKNYIFFVFKMKKNEFEKSVILKKSKKNLRTNFRSFD